MPPKSQQPSVAETLARTVRGWELHPLLTEAVQDVGLSPTPLLSRVLTKTSKDLADCLVDSRCATGMIDLVGTAESIWAAAKDAGAIRKDGSAEPQSLYNTAAALQERQSLMALYACQCLMATSAAPPGLFPAPATSAAAGAASSRLMPPGYRSPNIALILAQSESRAEHVFDVTVDLADSCGIDVRLCSGRGADLFSCFDVKQAVDAAERLAAKTSAAEGTAGRTHGSGGSEASDAGGGHGRRGTIVVTTATEYMEWSKRTTLGDVRVLLPPSPTIPSVAAGAAGKREQDGSGKEPADGTPASASASALEPAEAAAATVTASLSSSSSPRSPSSSSANAATAGAFPMTAVTVTANAVVYPWIGLNVVAVVVEDIALVQAAQELAWVNAVRSFEAAGARFRRQQLLIPLQVKSYAGTGAVGAPMNGGAAGVKTQSFVDLDRTPHHLWLCLAPLACVSPLLRSLLDRKNRRYYPLLFAEPKLNAGTNGGRIAPQVARSLASTYPMDSVFLRLLLQLDEKDGLEQVRAILEKRQYFRKVSLLTHTKEIGPLQGAILSWSTCTSSKGVSAGSVASGSGSTVVQRSATVVMRHDRSDILAEKVLQWLYGTHSPTTIVNMTRKTSTSSDEKGGDGEGGGGSGSGDAAAAADPLMAPGALVSFDGSPVVDLMDTDCLIQMYPPQKSLLTEEWVSFIQSLHTTANGELDIEAALWRSSSHTAHDVGRRMQQLHRGLSVEPEVAAAASTMRRPCVLLVMMGSKDVSLVTHFLDQYYYSGATGVVPPQASGMHHSAVQSSSGSSAGKGDGGGTPSLVGATLSTERANPPVLNVAAHHPLFASLVSCEAECAWGRFHGSTQLPTLPVSYGPCGAEDARRREADRQRAAGVMARPATAANVLRAKMEKMREAELAASRVAAGGGGGGGPNSSNRPDGNVKGGKAKQPPAQPPTPQQRQAAPSSTANTTNNSGNGGGSGGKGGGGGTGKGQKGKGSSTTAPPPPAPPATPAVAKSATKASHPSSSSTTSRPAAAATASAVPSASPQSPPPPPPQGVGRGEKRAAASSSGSVPIPAPASAAATAAKGSPSPPTPTSPSAGTAARKTGSTAATVNGLLQKMGIPVSSASALSATATRPPADAKGERAKAGATQESDR